MVRPDEALRRKETQRKIHGRDRDDANAPKVAIINERMAKQFWKGKNPIGQRINLRYGTGTVEREIVGIVGNIKHFGLDQEVVPEFYSL